jgi:hypothetical protein
VQGAMVRVARSIHQEGTEQLPVLRPAVDPSLLPCISSEPKDSCSYGHL